MDLASSKIVLFMFFNELIKSVHRQYSSMIWSVLVPTQNIIGTLSRDLDAFEFPTIRKLV